MVGMGVPPSKPGAGDVESPLVVSDDNDANKVRCSRRCSRSLRPRDTGQGKIWKLLACTTMIYLP